MALTEDGRETDSGIEVKPVYTADDVPAEREPPGEFPFTRGPYPDMYRGRPWTIRQYAGFASAEETNQRFRYLLDRGQTGLSGIPLGEVSTSMTINAPAALLLLLYELVAEQQGVSGDQLRGTVQNDILKEYIARGNYIFPPRPSMRITTDLFAYCSERIPKWNTISISGYHIREAGSTAVQELAFTLANGIAYAEAAVAAGLSPDEFGERLSFFFNAHNHFFQEVAKFRAARRLWARIMRERFGATNPKAQALRFHAQTGGSTLTAQQPENNVVRVAIQALSAVAGGAQSIHTNGYDEALALPSERSAHLALRTQQLLAHEAGGTDTADPLGGAYFIEALTDELEEKAWELIQQIDELGGAVSAVEQGFIQGEIEQAAFRWQQDVESGERVIVGVNRFTEGDEEPIELHRLDPEAEQRQLERTARVRAERNAEEAERAVVAVGEAARGDGNLLVPMREALRARATVGEISNALRAEFGTYDSQQRA
jgi:methylmalonyl-CoA mutase N-terminal domain/subunit